MSGPEAHWRAALAEGRFLIQRSAAGKAVFPPRLMAPGEGGALDWVEASGRGTVHSFSWIQQRPPEPSYNVAVIELDEGARLMSRVEGVREGELAIGQRVAAFVDTAGDAPLLLFRLEDAA
ncbi:MAG TPA: OB-fold domain-containing protein [Croceicoccus sp.]|nr:OB-fold domain-containing protein [Croceicoccus sp.]